MMNTSFRNAAGSCEAIPIAVLEYQEVSFELPDAMPQGDADKTTPQEESPPRISLSEDELEVRLQQAAAEARKMAEDTQRREFEAHLQRERAHISDAIGAFRQEQADYYARVEPELVHLILAVAARILHREAQVDPMLLAALAKVAVENLQQRSHVVLRVAPELSATWREYFALHLPGTKVEVLEDSQLALHGCILETDLGAADVGIEAQLKEIERGFFDLLAKRPEPR